MSQLKFGRSSSSFTNCGWDWVFKCHSLNKHNYSLTEFRHCINAQILPFIDLGASYPNTVLPRRRSMEVNYHVRISCFVSGLEFWEIKNIEAFFWMCFLSHSLFQRSTVLLSHFRNSAPNNAWGRVIQCLIHFMQSFRSADSTFLLVHFFESEKLHPSEKTIFSRYLLSLLNFEQQCWANFFLWVSWFSISSVLSWVLVQVVFRFHVNSCHVYVLLKCKEKAR